MNYDQLLEVTSAYAACQPALAAGWFQSIALQWIRIKAARRFFRSDIHQFCVVYMCDTRYVSFLALANYHRMLRASC
jgi:hypothetical protein